MLLRWDGRSVAVIVDEVVDLVPASALTLTPGAELPGVDPALVRAVALRDEGAILLLDLDALFRPLLAA